MKVALYARVSTRDKQTPETQLMPLRDFAKLKCYTVQSEYVDVGISGSKSTRPALTKMMTAAKRGEFQAVLVWKFDRFARSTAHLLSALAEFHSRQIDFISLSESIDTSTPVGKMVFTILGAVAEMERALIRERVQAGVERARRQGKQLGRPQTVNRETVLQMLSAHMTIYAIAKQLGCSRSSVRRAAGYGQKPIPGSLSK